jgi:signal recognition particle receptor subunit beta
MPVVNPLARELVFKIVYYGPGLGGKTTSLQYIHATSKPEHRGKMVSLATPVDRTLYFDFLPIRVPNVRGMAVRLQLFTVPGQVYYNATRKLVLTGADGVVLVADSQRSRVDADLESLENLRENLREHGRMLPEVPHVVQYNKRDLVDVLAVEELERRLNPHSAPSFSTIATKGDGIYEALEAITRAVLEDFERRMPEARQNDQPPLALPEGGLTEALRRADAPSQPPRHDGQRRPSGILRLDDLPPVVEAAPRVTSDGPIVRPSEPPHTPPSPNTRTLAQSGAAVPEIDGGWPTIEPGTAPPPLPAPAAARKPEPEPPEIGGTMPTLDAVVAAIRQPPREPAPVARPGTWSFELLWPPAERGIVRDVEAALADHDFGLAIALSDQLFSRALASAASVLGATSDAPRDPATVVLLLGLDGRRYLEFRALVRDARSGRDVGQMESLAAFAFAIEARLARARVGA